MVYDILPIPKPRMTQRDKWAKRPCVMRYWSFKDEVRANNISLPEEGYKVTFVLPMPVRWSKKRKAEATGKRHQSKPDLDNLVKALNDAVMDDDSEVWNFHAKKIWGEVGAMEITPIFS